MFPGPKRHASSECWQPLSNAALEGISHPEVHVLIPEGSDGLRADAIRLPPGSDLQLTHLEEGEGQFIFMLVGAVTGNLLDMRPWDHIFIPKGEAFPQLKTGDHGAELLTFSLPCQATEYL